MFKLGLRVSECIEIFKDFARKAFLARRSSSIPLISAMQKAVVSYLADSMYPSSQLDDALKEVFGETMRMCDCSYAESIGTKIAVTATTIGKCEPCLFTNYQGDGTRPHDCGKSPPQRDDEFLMIRILHYSGAKRS